MSIRRLQRPSGPRGRMLALCVVVTSLAALLSAPPAVAAPLRLAVSPGAALAGETTTFSGGVPATGTRRVVVLQRRTGSGWVDVVRSRASTTGVVRLAAAARSTTTSYRVLAPATKVGRKSYRVVATPTVRVVAQAQSGTVELGADRRSVTATFSPARAGRPVDLQLRGSDGSWRVIGRGVQDSRGGVGLRVAPGDLGAPGIRAVARAHRGASAFTVSRVVARSEWIVGAVRPVAAAPGGQGANGFDMRPQVSGDGRFVVFASDSTDLAGQPMPEGVRTQLYRKDLRAGSLRHVTRTPAGLPSAAHVLNAVASHDGRFVAFETRADDLGPADDDGFLDVYLWDALDDSIVLVSPSFRRSEGVASFPRISSDGRYVSFVAEPEAYVLEGPDRGTLDTLLWDRTDGSIIHALDQSEPDDDRKLGGTISGDGQHLLFTRRQTDARGNIVDTMGVLDRRTGTSTLYPFGGDTRDASLSADGSAVVFEANDRSAETGSEALYPSVFLWDVQRGTRTLVSKGPQGSADDLSYLPRISADGQWVSFVSRARNLVPDVPFEERQLYRWSRRTGELDLLSRGADGLPAGNLDLAIFGHRPVAPSLSADGRLVVWQAVGSAYFPGEGYHYLDALLWDGLDPTY